MDVETKTRRCVSCRAEFSDSEIEKATDCPHCHDTGGPLLISEDVSLKINWGELRILCFWADHWASTHLGDSQRRILASILRTLHKQFPQLGSLTLADEVQELSDSLDTIVELEDAQGRQTFKPKRGTLQ